MQPTVPISLQPASTIDEALGRLSALEHEVQELRLWLLTARPPKTTIPTPSALRHDHGDRAEPGCWEVTCLGHFELRRGGNLVPPCRSRRGQSILKYLLASPGYTAAADALMEAFWPAAKPSASAHNLQMAVSSLRQALRGHGPDGSDRTVLFRAEHYALNPELSIVQDVDRFRDAYARGRQAAATGRLDVAQRAFEEARRLYGGAYLADSPYEAWAENQRATLQDMQLGLLSQLSTLYGEASDWEQAAACCREVLAVDPYREDAYRQLMRSQSAQGRLADVQRTYRSCREHLWHDLQVAPAADTERLYQCLMESRAS